MINQLDNKEKGIRNKRWEAERRSQSAKGVAIKTRPNSWTS